jgi:D-alanyl-D-alanine carboxypeptidase
MIAAHVARRARSARAVKRVRLVGHADRDPGRGPAFERRLSGQRAEHVRAALLDAIERASGSRHAGAGIAWQIVATGASRPAVRNPRSETDRARNRRVEIWLDPSGTDPSSPPFVRWIQACLARVVQPGLAVTGRFDEPTHASLGSFQTRRGLQLTSTLDMATFSALAASCTRPPGLYCPPGGRLYSPAAATFRCAPVPATVAPATFLPAPTPAADGAARAALTQIGLSAPQLSTFAARGGIAAIRPVAEEMGPAALEELLRRLRYTSEKILSPPTTFDHPPPGIRLGPALLVPRLLLTIPGHFRELARRAPTASEAHALETIGWLLMAQLRDEVARVTGSRWWVPAPPAFVTPFANPLPPVGSDVSSLIIRRGMIDSTLALGEYAAFFNAWNNGLPGTAWRLETGIQPSALGAGQPFYPQTIALPAVVNTAAERRRFDAAWAHRRAVTEADPRTPRGSPAWRHALSRDERFPASVVGLLGPASVGGLELSADFPILPGSRLVRSLTVLRALEPVFTQLFQTIRALGWNDLVYQTAGTAVFRGRRPRPWVMSNHGWGGAIDLNSHENPQRAGVTGSMDPRIVAVFEAFSFGWGRCFPAPDPMHFEYCGTGC